jgi:DNA-binding NarL/FixJ family response regulator
MSMSSAKPTLGYSTRCEAVCRLRASGLTPAEIADKLSLPVASVRGRDRRMVTSSGATFAALAPAAARRGMSPNSLARLIVETVVAANLIDAVLDDG